MTEEISKPNQTQKKSEDTNSPDEIVIKQTDDAGNKKEFVVEKDGMVHTATQLGGVITQTTDDMKPKKSNRPKKQIGPLEKH